MFARSVRLDSSRIADNSSRIALLRALSSRSSKAITFLSENGFREERAWKDLHNNVSKLQVFFNKIKLLNGNRVVVVNAEKALISVGREPNIENTGLYEMQIWGEADSLGNGTVYTYTDTATKMTMVTDYIYGKDNGTNDGGYWRLNRVSPTPGGLEVSSSYDIYADADLYSVDAHISDWSIPGSEVYVVLYEEDLAGGDPILLDQSDNYEITQSDLGAWVNIPFLSAHLKHIVSFPDSAERPTC